MNVSAKLTISYPDTSVFNNSNFDELKKDIDAGKFVTSDYKSVEKYSHVADFFVRLFTLNFYSLEKHYNCNLEHVFKKIQNDVNSVLFSFVLNKIVEPKVKKSDVELEMNKIDKILSAVESNNAEIKFNPFSGLIENIPGSWSDYSLAHLCKIQKMTDDEVNKEIKGLLIDSIKKIGNSENASPALCNLAKKSPEEFSSINFNNYDLNYTDSTLKISYKVGGKEHLHTIKLSEKLKNHFFPKRFQTKEQMLEKLKELRGKCEVQLKNKVKDPSADFAILQKKLLDKINPLMTAITDKKGIEANKKDSLIEIHQHVWDTLKNRDTHGKISVAVQTELAKKVNEEIQRTNGLNSSLFHTFMGSDILDARISFPSSAQGEYLEPLDDEEFAAFIKEGQKNVANKYLYDD